jgi:5'-deoxynucleotidase YfbR-like HD superfamily hydrolase
VTVGLASPRGSLAGLRDLLGELGDLKRIRSAERSGSIAERAFLTAWSALMAGDALTGVMRATTARALAAARLGDLDDAKLRELGLTDDECLSVLDRALDDVSAGVDGALVDTLRVAFHLEHADAPPPRFAVALAAQPRAGATCPGKPRLVLEPAENHGEHCWAVAVYGVLLASHYAADPEVVFLAGLAHHLHNAFMPDSGFTGEVLLGDHLDRVCAAATSRALEELPDGLRRDVVKARKILSDASTPEGRAFHAADVIDRVLQLSQHLRPASLSMRDFLVDWELVHDGPVKPFHDRVLAEIGLA